MHAQSFLNEGRDQRVVRGQSCAKLGVVEQHQRGMADDGGRGFVAGDEQLSGHVDELLGREPLTVDLGAREQTE